LSECQPLRPGPLEWNICNGKLRGLYADFRSLEINGLTLTYTNYRPGNWRNRTSCLDNIMFDSCPETLPTKKAESCSMHLCESMPLADVQRKSLSHPAVKPQMSKMTDPTKIFEEQILKSLAERIPNIDTYHKSTCAMGQPHPACLDPLGDSVTWVDDGFIKRWSHNVLPL